LQEALYTDSVETLAGNFNILTAAHDGKSYTPTLSSSKMPSSETESSNTPLGCLTPSKEQEMGSKGKSMEDVPTKEERRPVVTFPEGGLRACLVATGSSLVLFSTFGYANAFG
jgi:hypothetical protein